jgi:alanine-glyoxylate transaminase/serine-glyoxylate transaminase/serine-pyruvate transaminase
MGAELASSAQIGAPAATRIKAPASGAHDQVASLTDPPQRVLMAPGPSNLHPRVVQALGLPLLGHKDPVFLSIMDETAELLRGVFQTSNRATFALPATGGSAMDAALINLLEPGDTVVVGRSGFFAERMLGIARRLHEVNVVTIDSLWGETTTTLAHAVREHHPRVLAPSTARRRPGRAAAARPGRLCREGHAAGGRRRRLVGWDTLAVDELARRVPQRLQKCLSAPPGVPDHALRPGMAAIEAARRRSRRVPDPAHARFGIPSTSITTPRPC